MKHLPNLLTGARLALTPYIFWLMWRHEYSPLIPWFIVIAVTDVADGFLARHYHFQSRLGAYLDPIADKVLLSGSFLVLGWTGAMDWWLAVIVLGRDLLILAGAGILYWGKSRREFPPSAWGKISTLAQVVFVAFQVGWLAGISVVFAVAILKAVVAILAVISLLDYVRRALQVGKPDSRTAAR